MPCQSDAPLHSRSASRHRAVLYQATLMQWWTICRKVQVCKISRKRWRRQARLAHLMSRVRQIQCHRLPAFGLRSELHPLASGCHLRHRFLRDRPRRLHPDQHWITLKSSTMVHYGLESESPLEDSSPGYTVVFLRTKERIVTRTLRVVRLHFPFHRTFRQ